MSFPRIITYYVLSLYIAAAAFAYFEATSMRDAMYWAVITSTTVGFGDLAPKTAEMRGITSILCIFWVFYCIPCVIALILGKIIKDEHKFTHQEQEWIEESLQRIAKHHEIELPPRK